MSGAQEQRLLTRCDGRYDKMSIAKALRKLDKVVNQGRSFSCWTSRRFMRMTPTSRLERKRVGEEFLFGAEGDLDGIYSMLEAWL